MTPRPTLRARVAPGLLAAAAIALLACTARPAADTSLASLTAPEATAVLRLRAQTITATASTGTMALTSRAGDQVTIDFAARTSGDAFRLRAWRFGETVLDITLNARGAWVYSPMRDGDEQQPSLDIPAPEELARAWRLISGEVLHDAAVATEAPDRLTLAATLDDQPLQAIIDRARLRPIEYRFPDHPNRLITIDPANWIDAEGQHAPATRWPHRVTLTSDRGVIDIAFQRVQVNPVHPAGVFDPPARAEPYRGAAEGD